MKRHLTEGELRASLDGELDEGLSPHLNICSECREKLRLLDQARLRAANRLSFLTPGAEPVPPVDSAWSRFTRKYKNQKETSMFKKLFAFPAARAGAAVILVLALLMAFPYTRALAGELLNLFRVQQVAVLPLDLTALESLTGNDALVSRLSELISDSTVITDEPGDPVVAADAGEASALAGFNVRLPDGIAASKIYVTDSAAFTFTVDRTKAQSLIDEAGRSDLVLPGEIDGAEIAVSTPAAVNTAFGTCPEPQMENSETDAPPESYPDCVIFTQMTSPMINAPESVDMAALARIGLELAGMSREDAEAFTAGIDWMTTLVVPIPKGESTHEDVSVDDVTGKLVRRTSEYAPEYALLWVKDGIIYFISGQGTDPARAFEIADALP